MPRPAHFLAPILINAGGMDASGRMSRLLVEGHERPLAGTLEVAVTSAARRRGLLGRDAIGVDAALAIAPCAAVHTFFMRFPIDLVFASREGRVLKICSGVRPWRVRGTRGAFAVIEMAAGAATRSGLRVGDQLRVDAIAG